MGTGGIRMRGLSMDMTTSVFEMGTGILNVSGFSPTLPRISEDKYVIR